MVAVVRVCAAEFGAFSDILLSFVARMIFVKVADIVITYNSTLRFEPPKNWASDITKMDTGYNISHRLHKNRLYDNSPHSEISYTNSLITKIRIATEALRLFPNVQELFISYEAPRDFEFNILIAILRGMIGHSICDTLQRLELQISREGNVEDFLPPGRTFCWEDPVVLSFDEGCSKLSPGNRTFVESETEHRYEIINSSINEIVPKLPRLREMRIVAYDLPLPFHSSHYLQTQETALYYIPLAFAPNLEKLCVETEFCVPHAGAPKGVFESQFLHEIFMRVKDLRIIGNNPEKRDLEILVDRFPHLQYLDFGGSNWVRPHEIEPILIADYYGQMGKLTGLRYIKLLWPPPDVKNRDYLSPQEIKLWVEDLLKNGLDQLQTVALVGSWRSWNKADSMRLQVSVKRTGNGSYELDILKAENELAIAKVRRHRGLPWKSDKW
ncbi:hypothetical protein TWF694_006733 [Orbilia ellipsospora]|uniref:Uncharacterized protein n=1 Tax=Orbilia ellipsospora TaxID=2528407 RepID=A0AAV9XLF2_9PEZI